ncbi:hypothetical protein GCM10023168_21900 [Fodinibacter luteus]|uniref:Alpha/beta hydrolase n=1 Tax=Fodinibacter luteus TaxID=552064 RepID=A0ABP8KGI7_9MICO
MLAACSGGATPGLEPAGPRPSGTSVLVTSGVRYAAAPPGWSDPTFDLYLPADAGQPPVAVIVPDAATGATAGGRGADDVALARDLAARGVATAVVHWGVESAELRAVVGRPAEDVVEQTARTTAEVSCAVAVAAARTGPRVGTPARPLVVVGHGTGANAAATAVLLGAPPFPSCFEPGATPRPIAAVLWDGDWLGAVAEDALGDGAASFLTAYSPWPSVDALPRRVHVELGVNANRLVGQAVEVGPTSSYLTTRDPGGTLTDDLARAGAFDDGALDPVDVTRAFAVGLRDAGLLGREQEVHGEADPETMGPRVRALVAQSVVELTRP